MRKQQNKKTLLEIGYTLQQIESLFEDEPDILNAEDAIQKLELIQMGCNHKFEFDIGN